MTHIATLPNGVRVVADPTPGARTFALTVAVRGGARWEDEARSGWSHFLEHMVFKGAGDRDAQAIVEAIEAEGGSINAATGHERTSFEVRGLAGSLPTALEVVSDLMFRPMMDPVEIAREKDVIAQEIAEAFDTPDDHVFDMAGAMAWAGQPAGRPILGSTASLAPIAAEALSEWRRRLYEPSRMVVVVSGAVDADDLMKRGEAAFGVEPAGADDAPEAMTFTGGHAVESRRIEQANLVFQLPGVAWTDADQPALRIFGEILGGGMASRLFQSARERLGLAYAIDAWSEPGEDAGVVGIYAGSAADRAERLAEVAAREVADLAEKGPSEAELSRAKAVLKASLWMADESLTSRSGRLAAQVLVHGAPRSTEDQVAALEAVTVSEVRAVGRRILAPGRSATAVLGPRAAGKAGRKFHEALFG
ncbi:M16 family metallopeptidase [Brevundimonas lutea]|uniref:M16 family metallopeptidase n=1 Tax=Brevundimonas lutea TaxID=2293980 RepID=UPI0013CE9794|nr:pitrilysin family protein [Brevundimonas lutea]